MDNHDIPAVVDETLAEVGWPVTASWSPAENGAQGTTYSVAQLIGPKATVIVWCDPVARGSALPALTEIVRAVSFRRAAQGGSPPIDMLFTEEGGKALAALLDRRLRVARFASNGWSVHRDGTAVAWAEDRRWWSMRVAGDELAYDVWEPAQERWREVVRLPLPAREARVLDELLHLLAWLRAVDAQEQQRALLVDLVLGAIRRVACGELGLRPSVADLRSRIAATVRDAPRRPTLLPDVLTAWYGAYALTPELEPGTVARWLVPSRAPADVEIGETASWGALRRLPHGRRRSLRLWFAARGLRRAGRAAVLVCDGHDWQVAPRDELVRRMPPLPSLEWLTVG
ncbi:hypothetical protein [Conexibacter woesei]|uniref:Uncharacterized protein n=1 Tax=Conexibacter woesei (strain DSM 14684 / CCUG 47730 / CIP 108061 / JCM 11494 / NBRC 100937 / ID131577) TaxID=469383 RepID=D3EZ06_CONWI|nr:hypothetical protein [Conexibacter woesei]ADB49880.1 hypothetical protein Cwoe_1452 [Conexibacter woesei DSM 14684]